MSHISSSLNQQLQRQKQPEHRNNTSQHNLSDFALKNKLLFECLFCKEQFASILSYLNHISKHEMKQIHKCTICKKIVIDDKHFHDHLLGKHREFVDIRVEKNTHKSEVNNNLAQKANSAEMDNFYHQLPYSYYQQFPQITTPILSNYIPPAPQAQSNNSNIAMAPNKPQQAPQTQNQSQQQQSTAVYLIKTEDGVTGGNQFKCHDCDETLATLEEFNDHVKRHNLDSRKHFQCNLCGKSYTQSSSLGFHKRKIHGSEIKKEVNQQKSPQSYGETYNQIFECHRCNKQFSRPSSLKQHYLVHKEIKPHRCDVCDLAFSASSQLLLHKISHTNRDPYRCQYCDKEFAISDHHKRHLRTHTKEKPFKCDLCGRSFSQSNTLTQHQRIHTGLKPYKCIFCDKKFSVLNYLNNHLRTCKESKSQNIKSNP